MSNNAKLLISSKFEPRDIVDILKAKGAEHVERQNTHSPSYCIIDFISPTTKENRSINFHFSVESPIGPCNLLTMDADSTGQIVLRMIAVEIGGFFCPNEGIGHYDEISGKLFDGDGIAYFLKYAVTNGFMKDNHDFEGFKQAVEHWNRKYKK